VLHLAFQPSDGNAFDNGALGKEEEDDNGYDAHHRCCLQSQRRVLSQRQRNSKAPPSPEIPPALASVFEQKLQPDGKFIYGGMATALRVLYGADAPTKGRAHQEVTDKVEEYIKFWKSSRQTLIVLR
jgi:hypothetical protein